MARSNSYEMPRARFFNTDPHQPLGAQPPTPSVPSYSPLVSDKGITTSDEHICRNDRLLARAMLAAGVRWHQLIELPNEAFSKPAAPGQKLTAEAIEKRMATYEVLRKE
jgi:hypothetical protein